MENYQEFYHLFVDSLQNLRKKSGTTVSQLCSDSHVSTRTYAKMVKKIPVKPECCIRLLQGSCKGSTEQEFLEFLHVLGVESYARFCEN